MDQHMTKIAGVPDASSAKPGMAFFAGTGPSGKTCGDCKMRGYMRESRNGIYDQSTNQIVHRTYRVTACHLFKKMAGHHGPSVDKHYAACRYFEQKEKR